MASGKFIGEGNTLKNLNYARFYLHGFLTPTLILFAWNIYSKGKFPFANSVFSKAFAIVITIGLISYEFLTTIRGLTIHPVWKNGMLTYENISASTSNLMIIVITGIILIISILLIIKFHFFALITGTILVALSAILSAWIEPLPIMNIIEFVFIITLLITLQSFRPLIQQD